MSVGAGGLNASNSLCVVRTSLNCSKGSEAISHICRGNEALQGVDKEDGWA